MRKKILLIVATHGNEGLGVKLVKELQKEPLRDKFDSIIGNPKAFQIGKRFVDIDLNRVYPGEKKSKLYEERKAWENILVARDYEYVIDIHEAKKSGDNFIIIPKKNISKPNKEFLKFIDIDKVILWPSTSNRKTGPIAQFLDNCLEIEFGTKNLSAKKSLATAKKVITNSIDNIYNYNPKDNANGLGKNFYLVYGKLFEKDFGSDRKIEDFKKFKLNNKEEFFPLFTNQYLTNGILCYKMKLVP